MQGHDRRLERHRNCDDPGDDEGADDNLHRDAAIGRPSGVHAVTAEVVPVPRETVTSNNIATYTVTFN